MPRFEKYQAEMILRRCVSGDYRSKDFHTLPSDQVANILNAAIEHGYQQPKNANGSRARYFHAYLMRTARKGETV